MARLQARDEAVPVVELREKLHQGTFLEEVALGLQLICEESRLSASQEGQAPNDVSADGAPLLAMALTSACPLASVLGLTVDW